MISLSAKVELGVTALEVPRDLGIGKKHYRKSRAPVANRRPSERRIYKENQCRLIREQFEGRVSLLERPQFMTPECCTPWRSPSLFNGDLRLGRVGGCMPRTKDDGFHLSTSRVAFCSDASDCIPASSC